MSLKPILKIENGLIKTGNGIIFTTYSPPFKKLLLPCSNQEGFLNHHVLFAEDCDHFDHMKQDCTTLSNNKSVTCKTLCHVLLPSSVQVCKYNFSSIELRLAILSLSDPPTQPPGHVSNLLCKHLIVLVKQNYDYLQSYLMSQLF